jgi:CTP:molybdopterin cytidylyltransferase MocA
MRVAAVVVAAGGSTRLGEPKQLVRLGKENLLERAVRIAREAGCAPVVVVLGASSDVILAQCSLANAYVVLNEDWASGMGGSVGVGVGALQNVGGCVVMTCDMPMVMPEHLRLLMGVGSEHDVVASLYLGRRGAPAYFPSVMFAELMALRGDSGARELLQDARYVELEGGEVDVDTVADVERARGLLGLP